MRSRCEGCGQIIRISNKSTYNCRSFHTKCWESRILPGKMDTIIKHKDGTYTISGMFTRNKFDK